MPTPLVGHDAVLEVVERGPQVVNRVCGDDRNGRIGGVTSEDESADLALWLALDPFCHTVWLRSRVLFDCLFEVGNVFFGPTDLFDERKDERFHQRLSVEDVTSARGPSVTLLDLLDRACA